MNKQIFKQLNQAQNKILKVKMNLRFKMVKKIQKMKSQKALIKEMKQMILKRVLNKMKRKLKK